MELQLKLVNQKCILCPGTESPCHLFPGTSGSLVKNPVFFFSKLTLHNSELFESLQCAKHWVRFTNELQGVCCSPSTNIKIRAAISFIPLLLIFRKHLALDL